MRGVVYVAYGDAALKELRQSMASLNKQSGLPIAVVSEKPVAGARHISFDAPGWGARWAKLNLDTLSPFDETLYLDADTRVHANVETGFEALAEGWDMALTLSTRQGTDIMGHVTLEDKRLTLKDPECVESLALQAGVMFWQKGEVITEFFAQWRYQWAMFGLFDQGAFLRALARCPIRIWLLGRVWNAMPMEKDAIVEHLFGRARAR